MTAAVLTVIGWSIAGDPAAAVVAAVTVLVIACPHALGLAIPLVVAISTSVAARAGILVKDRLALERMRTVDVVLFDKTGTLSRGNHAVVDQATVTGWQPEAVLALAAAVEADSEHPVGRAIVGAAGTTTEAVVESFEALPGRGVRGVVDARRVAVGGPSLLETLGLDEPPELAPAVERWRAVGRAWRSCPSTAPSSAPSASPTSSARPPPAPWPHSMPGTVEWR